MTEEEQISDMDYSASRNRQDNPSILRSLLLLVLAFLLMIVVIWLVGEGASDKQMVRQEQIDRAVSETQMNSKDRQTMERQMKTILRGVR